MITFLFGQDTYSSKQKVAEIISDLSGTKFSPKRLDLVVFNGENLDFLKFKTETESRSMFKEEKVIILEDIFSDKNFEAEFLQEGEKFLKTDIPIIIREEKEIDKRNALFKFLQKNAKTEEFLPLKESEVSEWLDEELKKCGAKIEPDAKEQLLFFVGNNLWKLKNEIAKLASFAGARKINKADIDELVNAKIENDIFRTIDAIASGKKAEALSLIHHHLEAGDSPLYLLSMINFQFRNLIGIKEMVEKKMSYFDISKKSKLHPFVIRKTYTQAQKFTFFQLKKIYRKIFQVDLSVKTGKLDPEAALDLFITGL